MLWLCLIKTHSVISVKAYSLIAVGIIHKPNRYGIYYCPEKERVSFLTLGKVFLMYLKTANNTYMALGTVG